jgi:hypothetical protein
MMDLRIALSGLDSASIIAGSKLSGCPVFRKLRGETPRRVEI